MRHFSVELEELNQKLLEMAGLVEFDATERIFTKLKEKQTEDYITGRFG